MFKSAFLICAPFMANLMIIAYIYWRDNCNSEATRKAHPASLYPNFFFEEIFSLCEEADRAEVEKLQKEIEAVSLIRNPDEVEIHVRSISKSTINIGKKYEECLQNYLNIFQTPKERTIAIMRVKNKIELGYKAITEEKSAFLSDNGSDTISFIFNAQNRFTDIFLTGIAIPMLLEVLKWEISGIEDFIAIIDQKPVMCLMMYAFLIVFLYRVQKYFSNKRSMLRGMKQTTLYNKAELMLCAFECALKNIDHTNQLIEK